METEANKVFKIGWGKKEALYPPDQVFIRSDFQFLLTIGGNLAEDDIEYKKLMTLLKSIGETDFFVVENIGETTGANKKVPYIGKFSTKSDFQYFQSVGKIFDPIFGWTTSHFFVFGNNENWGIYICEWPAINIIGCNRKYVNAFKDVFRIEGKGYEQLKEYISNEFNEKPELTRTLLENYRLEN